MTHNLVAHRAAVACYRQKLAGWVIALVLTLAVPFSWYVTIRRQGILAYYQAAGYAPEQVEQMRSMTFMNSPAYALVSLVPAALSVVFLLYVLRHCRRGRAATDRA